MDKVAYDEFGLFHQNAAEYALALAASPVVRREAIDVGDGRTVSVLVWGNADPELVFLHGGAQNAHTWDTVLLALDVPAIAIDLPGHGHSGWRTDGAYTPANLADDVAVAVARLAPNAHGVVGMSLGGMTALQLAVRHPHLVRRLMLVDITPGVNRHKAKAVLDFVNGPQSFPSFDSLMARTKEHNPTRTESSLRRGILHNAHQLDDGSWQWNYDRGSHTRSSDVEPTTEPDTGAVPDSALSPAWDDFAAVTCPMMLVRGGVSPVVDDDDVAEASRRQPSIEVEVVDGAGHSIQGDRPIELAALVSAFIPSPRRRP